jgi:parvulin-like peptidyl-prolyl isomerase
VLGAFVMYNTNANQPAARAGEGPFARINGKEIPMYEFESALAQTRDSFRMFASSGQPVTMQQQVEIPRYAYERILEEYAQATAAEANGVSVSTGEADSEARRQVEERLKQIGEGAKPEELAEYRNALLSGIDVEAERRRLLGQRLREKVAKEARPVEVRVAHVLIKTDTRSEEAARQLAQTISREARAGGDFSALVKKYSEDPGSKANSGIVGWASAMPAPPPTDPKKKPDPNAATSFVPEFTAAALRLHPNQVSDPVRSSFGYHVLKALEERPYQPTGADAKDPKKRDEALQNYQRAVADQMANGLFSAARAAAKVEPLSPWLKGYLAEQKMNEATAEAVKQGKAPTEQEKLAPVIAGYSEALKTNRGVATPALAYKLAQLYIQSNQNEKALEVLDRWTKRSGDPEMYLTQGETLEKLKRKTDALAAYQGALEHAFNSPTVLGRLADKFKALGRADLAKQATANQSEQLARQAQREKERQEQFKKAMAEQAADKKAQEAPKPSSEPVAEVTVKTGDIDPKTGKPKIISVTQSGPKSAKPGAKESSEGANKPAPKEGGTTRP